jgi:ADP-ribose pyrophosphatase YjhB (NUDIX family)
MAQSMNPPNWLRWSQKIQALAQSGLLYTSNPYDILRYSEFRQIASEIMAAGTQTDLEDVKMVFDAQSGYATPKLDIRGVLIRQGKILLVRELMDRGAWTLPGGWVEIQEPPSLSVEREMREEAGVIVKARRLLAIYDYNLHGHPPYPFHIYKLFFQCELIAEGKPDPLETSEPTYFSLANLPELSIGRVTPQEIRRMFELVNDPSLPTDFD